MWIDDVLKERNRQVYERSIRKIGCAKVHEGFYYYKGFEITKTNDRKNPWFWCEVNDSHTVPAKSKKQAMKQIDKYLIEINQSYKRCSPDVWN